MKILSAGLLPFISTCRLLNNYLTGPASSAHSTGYPKILFPLGRMHHVREVKHNIVFGGQMACRYKADRIDNL